MKTIELEFTLMRQDSQDPAELLALLQEYEAKQRIKIHVTLLDWPNAWSEISRAAIYSHGPDVSAVGTTWVADLFGMNALAPLPQEEQYWLRNTSAYLPQAYAGCQIIGDPNLWAVPWVTGSRVIYYRRDWLQKAAVKEDKAFESVAALHATLARLQKSGVLHPWVVTTQNSLNTLHHLASWVWGFGGDFISADGKQMLLRKEETLKGAAAYFALGAFLGPRGEDLNDANTHEMFWSGNAAVTIDGLWVLPAQKRVRDPEFLKNIGVALVPGVSFIGGTNLVLWKHSPNKKAALELMHFLTSPEAEMACFRNTGLLPTRLDLLQSGELMSDPIHLVFEKGLRTGRSWPNLRHGGLIENRLRNVLAEIWREVLKTPRPDLNTILEKHFSALEERMELILGS